MEERELSFEELMNVVSGKEGKEKALEHPDIFRQKKIEELKKEKDAILSSKEYQEAHINTQVGRTK